MKIHNNTKYRTGDLRAFVFWVARQEGYPSSYTKRLQVYADAAKMRHTGMAGFGSCSIIIRIPPPEHLNKPRLASLVAHEMRHNHQTRGTTFKSYSTEREMRGEGRYSGRGDSPEKYWSGADELDLRLVKPKAKPVVTAYDRAVAGRDKAVKMVDQYERKLKRTQNLVKKWQKKQRYYQKRMETASTEPPAKRAKREPEQLVRQEGERIVVILSNKAWEEVCAIEVDTFDASMPEHYGSEQEFNEHKAFCLSMLATQPIGTKLTRRRVRFTAEGARYFQSAGVGAWWPTEHVTAYRTLEKRQEEVGNLLKAASPDQS